MKFDIKSISNKIKQKISIKGSKKTETMTLQQLIDFLNIHDVNEKELSEATYFACLKILSESIGKLPLKLMKHDDRKGSIEDRKHYLYKKLRFRPNPYMTSTTFWSTVELIRNHFGNAYVWRDGVGEKMNLWILPTESVQIYINNNEAMRDLPDIFYIYTVGSKRYILRSDEILHFKTSTTFDGITGLPIRDILKTTIIGNNKAQAMQNKLYESGFTAKAVVQYTGNINDENAKTFVQNIANYANGEIDGTSSIIPIPIGSKLEPLNIKLGDNEFIELKKYSALQIASAFGIKPNQINDYSKSSYSNAEAQQIAFYVDTLLYIIKQYEEEIMEKTLSNTEIEKGYKCKFNVSVLLRADQKTQMEILTSAVSNFILTPNEARMELDRPSKPGGDSLIGNGSVIKAEQIGIQYSKGGDEDGEKQGVK